MKSFTCIVCPNGCFLTIDENTHEVCGNMCPRGKKYAIDEITAPKRSVTSSVRTTLEKYPVISVRTDGEISKDLIFPLMLELKGILIKDYLPIGSIVINNYKDTGVNVITTVNMEKE